MSEDRDRDDVLVRIIDTPQLARAVPRLRPEVLHAVIARYGLPDCGDLVALATPQQLAAVFDLDLWKAPRPGTDERFDPARFREWLEVLADADPVMAADRLAQQDAELVVAGLAPSIRVLDPGVFEPIEERSGADAVLNPGGERGVHAEIGGYVVVERRPEAWDAIVDVLVALDERHPTSFHRVMRGCRALSNAGRERDGLDELLPGAAQHAFDLTASREQRRDRLGFLPPDQARAFLDGARHVSLAAGPPATDTVFEAYRRAVDEAEDRAERDSAGPKADATDAAPSDVALVMDVLSDAGVIADPRRALPAGAQQATMNAALQAYLGRQPDSTDAWMDREQALGFLGNALVAGCSVRGRSFTPREASEAVAATCNLGLEYWNGAWGSASAADLVTAFKLGWSVLYHEVLLNTAEAIVVALDHIQTTDRDLQFDLRVLRRELRRACEAGTPWAACERLEVLSPLDLPAWAALTALLDECPVMLANVSSGGHVHRFNPSEFQFIANREHLSAVDEFLGRLAEALTR